MGGIEATWVVLMGNGKLGQDVDVEVPAFKDAREGLAFLQIARRDLLSADSDAPFVMEGRDRVLETFGPLFRERAKEITEADMAQFLDFEENCHWTGLHRQKPAILSNLPAVRKAVAQLTRRQGHDDDLETRFNFACDTVRGFGEGIVTPILFVAYPQHYGVWNSKSEFALKHLGLWIIQDKKESKGRSYCKVNGTLLQARNYLNRHLEPGEHPVDLWSIDYCWHAIKVMHDDGRLEDLIARSRPQMDRLLATEN